MMLAFGPFTFDTATLALFKDGVTVRLQPQPARVLALLIQRAGSVVSREDLRAQVWSAGTYVDFERGLNFAIAQIRAALGDSAEEPTFIETLPKRGYRFIAAVTTIAPQGASSAPTLSEPEPARAVDFPAAAQRWVAALGVVAAAVVFAIWQPWTQGAVRVAVVSFDNETGRDSFDAVAVSIADQTVARLATAGRVDRLAVIGNSAQLRQPRSFRDIQAIGRAVDAEYVVLAQMKTDATKVRLIAHLIRVRDEAHVWANVFDAADFGLDEQATIAEAIAAAVAGRLVTG
jgi:DNA-binding winged helix-turn-helix (wHTH) protein/TolB-like protein